MRKIEEHVNQYIIADLINLNFAHPHYPELKYDDLTSDVVQVITDSFMKLLEKDRVSDDMVQGIEEQAANRLDIDLEALKKQREKREEKEAKGAEVTATGAPKPTDDEDKPEDDNSDDGGSAGNGDKFLSDELPYRRELTEAEKKVNFAAIQKFLEKNGNDFEESAKKDLTAYIEHVAANPDEEIKLPDSYVKLIETTYKTAYNYGKLSASNEQSLPAPSTKKEQREHVKRYVDLVTEMQTSDIELMIKEARVKAPLNLADEDNVVNSVVGNLILASAAAWVLKVVLGTKGTISSQGMNDGRNDTFDRFASEYEAVWQWSSVMEPGTCSVCRALDGKTMTTEQKNKSIHQPPKHINCECALVQILKLSDEYTLPEVTGIDDDFMDKLETLRNTPKQQLIDEGKLLHGMTKVEKDSLLMYQGTYYESINDHFRFGNPISGDALQAAKRIDKVIARYQTGSDIKAYRGFSLDKELSVGDKLSDLGFFSTSYKQYIADEFALRSKEKYKYVLNVAIPKGYKHADINWLLGEDSLLKRESEILLSRGQNVIIKSMTKDDKTGITRIEAALLDETGKELSDDTVIVGRTQEELDAEDISDFDPESEEFKLFCKHWEHDNEALEASIIRAKK